MDSCCSNTKLQLKKSVLIKVLLINSVMFVIQFTVGILARSTSLLADSLDMLGDSLTYGISIYANNKGERWHEYAAIFKASIILLFALGILGEAIYKIFFSLGIPNVTLMIIFSVIAIVANASCLILLSSQKNTDINMHSTWVCARNDIVGNCLVILAALLVMYFHSRYPDIIIGVIFSLYLMISAKSIFTKIRIGHANRTNK